MYKKGSPETIQKVLDEVSFDERVLVAVADQIAVVCSPKNFLDLLSRIKNPKLQERAIEKSFSYANPPYKDCVHHLLTALESSTFDRRLKDFAIQEVFRDWSIPPTNGMGRAFFGSSRNHTRGLCRRTTCILEFTQ